YGSTGTPTTDALCDVVKMLESADSVVLAPTGRGAVAVAILSVVRPGDRLVIVDNVYEPTRRFAGVFLSRMNVETVYVDPLDHDAVRQAVSGAAALFLEAPGSQTFEVPDIPALAALAREAGAVSIMDNTWATPVFFRPLERGVDISVQSATKYYGGHADLVMGTVAANGRNGKMVEETWRELGMHVAPDDVFLALRGLRTLDVRLERHQRNARRVAEWLSAHSKVDRVLYPALPDAPGHALWKRDFEGATGLFSFVLKGYEMDAVQSVVDNLELFGIGYSWGGFESLVTVARMPRIRTATPWPEDEHVVRLHIGLEDPQDLIEDLERALARLP
ncbi:MAG: cystathionine beta-lyase, partial [Pseudomonadota bacterium]